MTTRGSWPRVWRFVRGAVAASMLASGLVACGGGGSDSDTFAVAFDRNEVTWTMPEGSSVESPVVLASSRGTPPSGGLYVGATTPTGNPDPNIERVDVEVDGRAGTAQIRIRPKANLDAGTHKGDLIAQACLDSTCRQHVNGSPYRIGYTITVTQTTRLLVKDPYVSLRAKAGEATSARVAISLPAGATTLPELTVTGPKWLTVGDVTATGFSVNAEAMPPGAWDTQVLVRHGEDEVSVWVRHQVEGSGQYTPLAVSSTGVTLSAVEGGSSPVASLQVTRPSWNPKVTMATTYDTGEGWLTASLADNGLLDLTAKAQGLPAGTYRATLVLSSPFPSQDVPVSVLLTVGAGLAVPAPVTVVMGSETVAGSLRGSVPVTAGAATSLTWTATTDVPWLKLLRTSGGPGQGVDFEVDAVAASALAAFEDVVANVTIQPRPADGSAVSFTPVTGTVVLRNELAQVLAVGPSTVTAGEGASVIVQGRGFDRVSDPASRLVVDGVTPLQVTRIAATALAVKLPAMPAAARTVRITNALGSPAAAARLHVLAPKSHAAASMGTGGVPYAVVHDPVRDILYIANRDLSAVQRFTQNAGTWTKSTLPFAGLFNIGLSRDGNTLVVAQRSGALSLVDVASFSTVATYQASGEFTGSGSYVGDPLAVTNDDKVWLSVRFGRSIPVYFDLRARRFETLRVEGTEVLAFDPRYAVSGNGERLLVVPLYPSTVSSPLRYHDTSQSAWPPVPAGSASLSGARSVLDTTGNRLLDESMVHDGTFAKVGLALHIPDAGWYRRASTLSADGRRVYVVAALDQGYYPTGPGPLPRVYVFDASVDAGVQTDLPLLGSFELSDHPSCYEPVLDYTCRSLLVDISADGRTLFVAGNEKLLVEPIPSTWQSPLRAAQGRMVPWALQR